jgi:hypothetical protein
MIRRTTLRSFLGKELDSKDWFGIYWPGAPSPIVMRLGSSDGRVVCSGLLLAGAVPWDVEKAGVQRGRLSVEITASKLREIPLGLLLDTLARDATAAELSTVLPEFQRPTRLGPRGIHHEKLVEVAALYRRALKEQPSAPVQWMSEQSGPEGKRTPVVTIRRWLQRCRDLKLLGPSIPGKAGEQSTRPRGRRPR